MMMLYKLATPYRLLIISPSSSLLKHGSALDSRRKKSTLQKHVGHIIFAGSYLYYKRLKAFFFRWSYRNINFRLFSSLK